MKTTILKGKSSLVGCVWLGLLWCLFMNSTFAQTNAVQSSLKITWSGAEREFYSYTLSPVRTNRVEIQLATGGKSLGKHQVERVGGMDALLVLAQQASKEVNASKVNATESKGDSKRRLEVVFERDEAERRFSVEGNAMELMQFFHSTTAMKELLRVASEQQPKAYRLIDESGPTKAMMLPPERR
jgi:hypothetical protein